MFRAMGGSGVEGVHALSWRALGAPDLPAVAELAGACLSADGGQPYAADASFLEGRYLSGAQARAGFSGTRLVCVSSLRRGPSGQPGEPAVTTGLVHPGWRRRGIGGHAFAWAAGQAGSARLLAETETLHDGAHALYLSNGLSQVFAEDVMRLAAAVPPPPAHPPSGLVLSEWGQASPARFFEVYQAAFRDRPGFPGWTQARWTEWISGGEDFRPEWALLATFGGTGAGFIVADTGGWIGQLGVVPSARGHGVGAYLISEAVRRMRAGGETTVTLNVSTGNPHAAALYRRTGFTWAGRRARYGSQA